MPLRLRHVLVCVHQPHRIEQGPRTGAFHHAAAPASHIINKRRTPDAADGDRQRKRERGAERNAERSGGTVAWLDTPAAEPPRLEVKYYPLSAFVAALIGLFIGRASNGLMVGVVYIKIVMLLFMAVPILSFLVGISQPLLSAVCYLVPSQATFEGIMDLSTGNGTAAVKDIFILLAHCIGWFLLYIGLSMHQRKNS